jgi:hypothetical protein
MKNSLKFLLLTFALLVSSISAKDFKGAEFRTKQSYLYGRFEVSLKSTYREGVLASFFTYNDNMTGLDQWNEIDIEIMGRYKNDVQFNTITPNQTNHVSRYPTNFNPHTAFHTYAFEWTPNYVAWFIDGVEVFRQTGAHIQTLNRSQKLMMNIWNPTAANWAGQWSTDVLPAFAYYDWVKYYTYTPGSGNYGTGNNFSLSWSDEFDYWNTARWEKGTHTFGGNGCDFTAENAVITNSNLILCLTDAINLGYTDVRPPIFVNARVLNQKVIATFSEELSEVTSQNTANYMMVGATVTSATLLPDFKSVELTVTGWDFTSQINLLVMNVKDRFNNSVTPRALTVLPQKVWTYPLKINCGGSAVLGYLADQEWNLASDYGYMDGSAGVFPASLQINGTDEDEIYRTERYDAASFHVYLPRGAYKVKLMFAENYFNATGKRIFDVYVENSRVLQNFDIFATVGMNTAYIKEINNVQVDDGWLDIQFAGLIDNPLIDGIVIEPQASGVEEGDLSSPKFFILGQNYPNPFNGQTTITFSVNSPDSYKFSLHNAIGETVMVRDLGFLGTGNYSLPLNSKNFTSSGVYFYTLGASKAIETKKLVLLN